MCDFREYATSAPAEFGGEIHNISRNRALTQVLLQAQKLHAYGSGTFGAFWILQTSSSQKASETLNSMKCSYEELTRLAETRLTRYRFNYLYEG